LQIVEVKYIINFSTRSRRYFRYRLFKDYKSDNNSHSTNASPAICSSVSWSAYKHKHIV